MANEIEIKQIKTRVEELRNEIRKERISYGEIAELQGLKEYIEKDDIELLAWATENCTGCGEPLLEGESIAGDRHSACI